MLTYEDARANPIVTDWDNQQIAVPWFVGKRVLDDAAHGARAIYGFWPANSIGDDIVVYRDDARNTVLARLSMLRQQERVSDGEPCRSLADFVAPKESMAPDYIGVFVLTGADEQHVSAFSERLVTQMRADWGLGDGRGCRVVFGDRVCPDVPQRRAVVELLGASEADVSMAGLYFSHPQAATFDLGRIGRDQLEDYAARRGMTVDDVERSLALREE